MTTNREQAEEVAENLEKGFFGIDDGYVIDVIRALCDENERLDARCDRDDKLIFKMKDEISKLKQTVNKMRQKLEAKK